MKLQSNLNCHICNTTSSGTFLHIPSLCLLNDDSGLCISSMQKRMLLLVLQLQRRQYRTGLHHTCVEKHIGSVAPANSDVWMYNGASWWGQAFDHWCLAMFSLWYTWLYKGVTFVFLLSFPLPLPFDWTLRCWVCVCCFVLLYFGCYVVLCEKKKKIVDNKKINIYIYVIISSFENYCL